MSLWRLSSNDGMQRAALRAAADRQTVAGVMQGYALGALPRDPRLENPNRKARRRSRIGIDQ